ncbi:MAG: hypothetical protein Q4C57_05215 [Bacillota bacterium]|nr:hypothetical protein [Bacillota bacterium]
MICKSCGAKYDKSSIRCPYCGTENIQAAGKQKREILQGYDKEATRIRREAEAFPQKAANRLTKGIVFFVGILALIGILFTILFIFYGKLSVRAKYRQEQIYLEKLEALYQEGQYEEMEEYCRKKDLYGRAYQKYAQVMEVNGYYERMESSMDEIRLIEAGNISAEQKKELSEYWIQDIQNQALNVLQKCREYAEDDAFLGNEQVMEEFYHNCVRRLQEFGYTEEEIIAIEGVEGS